ncbi:MAG TPA: YMGG-like glycine zipper-containing protein [Candidatus Hydrogenedentes bacterium]|nr:YMGG-like glycine zipper-containing protein [Candidatus Hydrogenedentota bacterium]HOS03691.1 YMGG-like glycine zipper-containing protein [Candidatus Hydrogenedentota bacterium]
MNTRTILSFLTLGAVFAIAATGCQMTPTQQGAMIGGATGAGLGAIIGNNSGSHDGGKGALIGGATGALAGALVGDAVDENRKKKAQTPGSVSSEPSEGVVKGHYETRQVKSESGETYMERVWVVDPQQ